MTKRVLVAMDSYRLAECAVPLACYICGTDNNYNTELCRHCAAPLALSHQARTQGVRPQMVAVLGTAAAGKTVYLGMLLDMLTRQNSRVQVLARGAFSITLQQRTMMALSSCRFPEKTPNEPDRWNWVHCQAKVNSKKNPMELIMPDMAGEAILEEIDHPNAYPAIHSFLEKCSAVILLADTDRIERGGAEQNYFLMKLITYLSEQDADATAERVPVPSRSSSPRPIAANPVSITRNCMPVRRRRICGNKFSSVSRIMVSLPLASRGRSAFVKNQAKEPRPYRCGLSRAAL